MSLANLFLKLSQLLVLFYVTIAVLYTTHYLLLSPILDVFFPSLSLLFVPAWLGSSHLAAVTIGEGENLAQHPVDASGALWPVDVSAANSPLYFPSTALAQELGMANAARTPINEATFLAKAFASALHPTRIIPFYYRSTGLVEDDDVTITTLVTANRFKVFKELVERYQGPISVTVHIPFPADASLASLPLTHPSVTALNRLHTLYTSSPFFSKYVDVHLALSPFAASARPGKHTDYAHAEDHTMEQEGEGEGGRQFNVWRNTARLFARTEFVMMLDVDFAVCTDWRQAVRDALRGMEDTTQREGTNGGEDTGPRTSLRSLKLVRELKEGRAALVVPAFEYANLEDGMDQRKFPRDKESLVQLTRASPPSLTSFHAAWAPGHNSTDYPQYYSIPPSSGEVYRVTQYQSAYEPYVIMSKRVTWCDERFTGYGANKAACLFEMYLSGVSFYVLADHFLIHQSHTYEEEARREERKYNRKLYSDFKEEACLRYLDRYTREGTLHTPRASNVREECKKIKNVARFAAPLLEM